MSGDVSGEGAQILTELDAVGNTTKAITKGIAIATAVLAATALFGSYTDSDPRGAGRQLRPLHRGRGGLRPGHPGRPDPGCGGGLPVLRAGHQRGRPGRRARSSTRCAGSSGRSPGSWRAPASPSTARSSTSAPGTRCASWPPRACWPWLAPIAVGFGLGAPALAGYLAGAIGAGTLMAVFLANSGGSWDNAKKLVEDGNHGGKGSPAHEATVIGDTVGDPFKDTAGPAINPLIKVMNLVALLIAPAVVGHVAAEHDRVADSGTPSPVVAARGDRDRGGHQLASQGRDRRRAAVRPDRAGRRRSKRPDRPLRRQPQRRRSSGSRQPRSGWNQADLPVAPGATGADAVHDQPRRRDPAADHSPVGPLVRPIRAGDRDDGARRPAASRRISAVTPGPTTCCSGRSPTTWSSGWPSSLSGRSRCAALGRSGPGWSAGAAEPGAPRTRTGLALGRPRIVIGAYTHVVWDSFTHANRGGYHSIPALNSSLGPLPGFKWLQYGCGIAGLVVLGWFLARWWRRTPPRPVSPSRCTSAFRRFALPRRAGRRRRGRRGGRRRGSARRPTVLGGLFFITVGRQRLGGRRDLVLSCCLYWWLSTARRRPGRVGPVPAEREGRS